MFVIEYDNGWDYSDNDHFPLCYVETEVVAERVIKLANDGDKRIISFLEKAYRKSNKSEFGPNLKDGYFYYTELFNLEDIVKS